LIAAAENALESAHVKGRSLSGPIPAKDIRGHSTNALHGLWTLARTTDGPFLPSSCTEGIDNRGEQGGGALLDAMKGVIRL
jgi:hypothetical protein